LAKERDGYDEETLLMLARVAESVEDYRTMQTYMRLFIDQRVKNTQVNVSINSENGDAKVSTREF
jgi:hypothetical protein